MLVLDIYVLIGGHILDYSGMSSVDQIEKVLESEIVSMNENEGLILLGAKNDMY